jgi:hypothetical protein
MLQVYQLEFEAHYEELIDAINIVQVRQLSALH